MTMDTSEVEALFEGMKEIGPRAMEYMGLDFLAETATRVNRKEGHLADSIQATSQSDYEWIIGTDMEYAPFVHEGTGEHDIGSPVMINGNWVYIGLSPAGKGKPHPGYVGNPFFDDSLEVVEGNTEEYLAMATEDLG